MKFSPEMLELLFRLIYVENAKVAAGGANGFSCGSGIHDGITCHMWNGMRDAGDTVHGL